MSSVFDTGPGARPGWAMSFGIGRRGVRPKWIPFLLFLPLSGCGDGQREGEEQSREPEDVWITGEPEAWYVEVSPLLVLGEGGTGTSIDFWEVVGAVRLDDGQMVVADRRQRLLLFDRGGSHIRTVGRRGSGPGEFELLQFIQRLPSDSLIVFDARHHRVSVFTQAGALGRTMVLASPQPSGLPPSLVGVFADGTLLSSLPVLSPTPPGGRRITRGQRTLLRHDRQGNVLDSLGTVWSDQVVSLNGLLVRLPFLAESQLVVGSEDVYWSPSDSFQVTVIPQDGGGSRIFRGSHTELPITPEDVAVMLGSPTAERLAGIAELFPAAFPAIADMALDDSDKLWIAEFTNMPDSLRSWGVVDRDGTLVATVEMPSRLIPLQIGDDFVLGVWRDTLDVESVQLHHLERTGLAAQGQF